MVALLVREYSHNLAASFTKAVNCEQVLIRMKNQLYAVVKIGRDKLRRNPEMHVRIDKTKKAIKSGKCVTLKRS